MSAALASVTANVIRLFNDPNAAFPAGKSTAARRCVDADIQLLTVKTKRAVVRHEEHKCVFPRSSSVKRGEDSTDCDVARVDDGVVATARIDLVRLPPDHFKHPAEILKDAELTQSFVSGLGKVRRIEQQLAEPQLTRLRMMPNEVNGRIGKHVGCVLTLMMEFFDPVVEIVSFRQPLSRNEADVPFPEQPVAYGAGIVFRICGIRILLSESPTLQLPLTRGYWFVRPCRCATRPVSSQACETLHLENAVWKSVGCSGWAARRSTLDTPIAVWGL